MWPRFFGHQNDRHRGDQQHGATVKHGGGQGGQAKPGGAGHARQVQWFAQAHAVGEHGIDHAGQQQAHQDQQALHHAARINSHQAHADKGDELHPGVKVACGHVFDGHAGQVQTDHGHHGAGDDRRHHALDPAGANGLHHQADDGVERAAGDDAAQRHADVGVGPFARVGGGRDHHADEGKTRTQVAGHLAAGDQKEDQGADAAHQDGDVRVKAHEDGGQHRGAKHGDHVLHAHGGGVGPGQAFVGGDGAALLQHLGGLGFPIEHGHAGLLV